MLAEIGDRLDLTDHEFLRLQRDFWGNYLRNFNIIKMVYDSNRLGDVLHPAVMSALEAFIKNLPQMERFSEQVHPIPDKV